MARPTASPTLTSLAGLARAGDHAPSEVLAATASVLVDRLRLPVDPGSLPLAGEAEPDPVLVSEVADVLAEAARAPERRGGGLGVDLLGQLHEALLDPSHRRRQGVFYTPATVAAGVAALIEWPSAARQPEVPLVCDPAVGGGAFLLASARALAERGYPRAAIVGEALHGVDVDPLAVSVAATSLVLWAAEEGPVVLPSGRLVVGDSLVQGPEVWDLGDGADRFDVVIGNPPFQNQLGRTTARPVRGDEAERLRERFGSVAFRYTDSAALFLLEACRWARPGGQVALVLPQSVLVADDATALRRAVLELGRLERLWVAGEPLFAASVRVCVPVVRRFDGGDGPEAGDIAPVEVLRGSRFTPVGAVDVDHAALAADRSWAVLRSGLLAAPAVDLPEGPTATLGSFCTATAGFRDQFYGLAPFVREAAGPDDDRPRLVTCGLLEPARCLWGERSTRFAGRQWSAPVVDVERLDADGPAALAEWSRQRLVPKVVVATQTRVLEAAVDEAGAWYPSVPTIALTCPPGADGSGLWEAAAVVMAPPTSVWAFGRHSGAALSDDALKVSARQLLDLPLPTARAPWCEAAAVLRTAAVAPDEPSWRRALGEFGRLMCDAYGVGVDVLSWWEERLPAWSRNGTRERAGS